MGSQNSASDKLVMLVSWLPGALCHGEHGWHSPCKIRTTGFFKPGHSAERRQHNLMVSTSQSYVVLHHQISAFQHSRLAQQRFRDGLSIFGHSLAMRHEQGCLHEQAANERESRERGAEADPDRRSTEKYQGVK